MRKKHKRRENSPARSLKREAERIEREFEKSCKRVIKAMRESGTKIKI